MIYYFSPLLRTEDNIQIFSTQDAPVICFPKIIIYSSLITFLLQ